MKFPLVSRKKYEILKENLKVKNQHNQALEKKSRKFQEENIELKKELDRLKDILHSKELLEKQKEIVVSRTCKKCNAIFTVEKKNRTQLCSSCRNKKKDKKKVGE